MSLEWFYRMENAVRQSLPDVCQSLEDYDVVFETDTTTHHPSFIFSVDLGLEEDEYADEDFCLIHFDPVNQEFYSYHSDEEADLEVKVLFGNLDEMLDFIHAAFHEYIEEDDFLDEDEDDEFDEDEDEDFDDDEEDFEDYDEDVEEIEWLPNDKYIHIEENNPEQTTQYIIHYRVGRVPSTGEGILMRNMITKEDDEEAEEGLMMFFKEEEVSYIIDLMKEYSSQQ